MTVRIADLLLPGEANAVTITYLTAVTKLNPRDIRHMIQRERLAGTAICSGPTGYYLAATVKEREQFVKSMRRRAKEITRVADAVEQGEID